MIFQTEHLNKKMAAYGIPDFDKFCEGHPGLELLHDVLDQKTYAAIKRCTISEAPPAKRCKNVVCPHCLSALQVSLIKQACKTQHKHRLRASMITYCSAHFERSLGSLKTFSISKAASSLRRAVQKVIDETQGPVLVIAGLDISLNEPKENLTKKLNRKQRQQSHVWAPHWHIVVICRNPETFAADLKPLLAANWRPNEKPFHTRISYCTGRHVCYATKLKPVRREVTTDSRGNANRKERPLANAPMGEALLWLTKSKENQRIITILKGNT